MICPSRTAGQIRRCCHEIAAEMRAVAGDPDASLSTADRAELVALAQAVEASRGGQDAAQPDNTSPASADGQS